MFERTRVFYSIGFFWCLIGLLGLNAAREVAVITLFFIDGGSTIGGHVFVFGHSHPDESLGSITKSRRPYGYGKLYVLWD